MNAVALRLDDRQHPNMAAIWTAAEVAELRLLWPGGLSIREIALQINLKFGSQYTKLAVAGKAFRLGLGSKAKNRPLRAIERPPEKVRLGCRWIAGDPTQVRDHSYEDVICNRERHRFSDWCAEHYAKVYLKGLRV